MSYFAQRDYPQHLGNGQYTISEAGCLLTAIANGLRKMNGSGPDPVTLNQFYLDHGLYIHDPDGANEDLAWGSINQYDDSIVVAQIGSGSLPPTNDAIVKFHYNSVHTGQPIDHFCWVDHIEGDQIFIIDSWDGQIKGPAIYVGVYHYPIGWATYVKHASIPAPSTPPAAPITIPGNSESTFTVIKDIPGYRTSGMAASRSGATVTVAPEKYYIFNSFNNMVNVTRVPGIPGSWINPGDNNNNPDPIPAPTPPPEAAPPPAPELSPAENPKPDQPDWRITYRAFRNKYGDAQPKYYVAMKDIVVSDLEDKRPDLKMGQYSVTSVSGTFSKDGISYGRPKSGADKFLWYGIPMVDAFSGVPNLELETDVYNSQTNTAERKVTKALNFHDYLVLTTAKVEKAVETVDKVWDIIIRKKVKK